ncbi:hypothetical protein ABH920_009242 [Catenulispora sp. EB89]|uniref:hypothetical protein n=1 Tax=Catenulispora sp. EB89 TaxID=3156257 RepID=UPI0035148A18
MAAAGGSGGGSGSRALTSDEANRLAITRFRNYETGGRAVTITVPGTGGSLVITGSVDYRTRLGYGVVRGTGRDTSSDGLIEWTATSVLVDPMTNAPAVAPAAPPTSGWYSRTLQKTGSTLDSSLAIALALGSDRPDNAQLLPQDGAAWVGKDQVAGHQVDVMTGPAALSAGVGAGSGAGSEATSGAAPGSGSGPAGTVRYWIGADGAMYRVQAAVASETQPTVIDFDTHQYTPVPSAAVTTSAPGQ